MNKKIRRIPLVLLLLFSVSVSALLIPAGVQAAFLPLWQFDTEDMRSAQDANAHALRNSWKDATARAARAHDPLVADVFRWRRYLSGQGDASFKDITAFLRAHPDWPEQNRLATRAELAIDDSTETNDVLSWFTSKAADGSLTFREPLTGRGKLALAESLLSSKKVMNLQDPQEVLRLIRESWAAANFTKKEEETFLARYGSRLRMEDHNARIDRLLWDNDTISAKRLLGMVDNPHRLLFSARIQLQMYNFGLSEAVNAVPASLRNDEGLLYDRITRRMHNKDTEAVLDLLEQLPSETEHPKEWWPIRRSHFPAMMERDKAKAFALVDTSGFSAEDGTSFADAQWAAGWIAFRYLQDYKTANAHFQLLYENVASAISRGRAAYWLARTADAAGDVPAAQQWYAAAAQYPTSFYGQIAAQKLGYTSITIPPEPVATPEDEAHYRKNTLLKAATLLTRLHQPLPGQKFVQQAIRTATTPGEKHLIAEFGLAINRPDYAIAAAKEAIRNNGPILLSGYYPVLGKQIKDARGNPIEKPEPALIHAIILQESIFMQDARSPVGALGLMQLMPATAKEVARKARLHFRKEDLGNARYNITLGSAYLQQLIDYYNGSYVLAVAAYNGGQGNVNKWIKANGDPRAMQSLDEVIDWIEQIPFPETQNYVQRVIENLQVYRARLQRSSEPSLHTLEDISR